MWTIPNVFLRVILVIERNFTFTFYNSRVFSQSETFPRLLCVWYCLFFNNINTYLIHNPTLRARFVLSRIPGNFFPLLFSWKIFLKILRRGINFFQGNVEFSIGIWSSPFWRTRYEGRAMTSWVVKPIIPQNDVLIGRQLSQLNGYLIFHAPLSNEKLIFATC